MNLQEMQLKWKMVTTAEIYLQRPDDPMFKKFKPEALEKIKLLAKVLQKARDEGRIDEIE